MLNYIRHDEEFYFTCKLVSGEEIIGKGFAVEDNGITEIFISDPVELSVVTKSLNDGSGRGVKGISMNKWMEFSDEDFFILNEKDIMTIGGLSQEMTFMYDMFIKKSNNENGNLSDAIEEHKLPLDKNMGHVGKISDIKKYLEKIYKSL